MTGGSRWAGTTEAIRLGEVEIWPEQDRLQLDGQSIHLEPKVMDVLVLLMAHPGDVVTRQTLMETVWAGRVVGDEVLTRCISELRSALGDRASNPTFIQTVPKKGYRLLLQPETASPGSPFPRHLVRLAAALVLAIGAVLALVLALLPESPTRIAVLPFTTAPADGHFGTGVAEELTNTLVSLSELRVSSRTSAFAENPETDPKLIGERLDVDTLLMGTLRRSDQGLRISAQLIDVESGDHLWADTFEGPEATLDAMQDLVLAGVAAALELRLAQPLRVAGTAMNINALDQRQNREADLLKDFI